MREVYETLKIAITQDTPEFFAIALLLFIGALLIKKSPIKILEVTRTSKRNDLEFLKNIAADNNISKTIREDAEDILHTEMIKKHLRIHAEKDRWLKLKALHDKHQNTISWNHIRLADSFLKTDHDNVQVNIRPAEYYLYLFNVVFSVFMFILFVTMAALLLVGFITKDTNTILVGLPMTILFIFATLVIYSTCWPYQTARKIEKLTGKTNQKSSQK